MIWKMSMDQQAQTESGQDTWKLVRQVNTKKLQKKTIFLEVQQYGLLSPFSRIKLFASLSVGFFRWIRAQPKQCYDLYHKNFCLWNNRYIIIVTSRLSCLFLTKFAWGIILWCHNIIFLTQQVYKNVMKIILYAFLWFNLTDKGKKFKKKILFIFFKFK